MKITRTIVKASYEVAYYNKQSGNIEKRTEYDTDNMKPEIFEKMLSRKAKSETPFLKVCDVEQKERLAFLVTMRLEWNGSELPTVTVENMKPVELPNYVDDSGI